MKLTTIKKLQRFVGTVATVLTVIGKQGFTDTQFSDHFTGLIDSIDEDGIFVTHPVTGEKGFYALSFVVALVNEQRLDPDNPEHAKIIEALKQAPPEQKLQVMPVTALPKQPEQPDMDLMKNLAKQAQDIQKKMVRRE